MPLFPNAGLSAIAVDRLTLTPLSNYATATVYFVVGGKAITYFGRLFNLLSLGMRRDRASIISGLVFFSFVLVASSIGGLKSFALWSVATNLLLMAIGLIAIAAPFLLFRLAMDRPESPFDYLRTSRPLRVYTTRIVVALPFLSMLGLFLPAFSLAKSHVGYMVSYSWDKTFLLMDRAIHGTDAWELIHPLIGYAPITFGIGMAYQIWILLLYVLVPMVWTMRIPKSLRKQFGLSYVLCWTIIGAILANIFSSVGPCFLEPMTGNNDFRPLMDYLYATDRQFPIFALDVQQSLLKWQLRGDGNLGRGISAMPSMHVSIAFLMYLMMRRIGRVAGWVFGAFFVIIFLGSIHLGYHYAVDGYLAIAVTLGIWFAVGTCQKFFGRSEVRF